MPSLTMPKQNGNSCAAHCTIIAVAELTGSHTNLSQSYTESTLWPKIKFVANGHPLIDGLAAEDNSDPQRLVAEAGKLGVTATLKCDEVEKATAMTFITDPGYKMALEGLFNMLKGSNASVAVPLDDGVYYNCSYLMLPVASAAAQVKPGMHNILVTKQTNKIYYYNSNEGVPVWTQITSDWKTLNGQNGNTHSYVFTGVYVEMKK